jgi:hypothetical protein
VATWRDVSPEPSESKIRMGPVASGNSARKSLRPHDLFREWARAVCWHSFKASTVRKYNTAIIFKRARGQGRITKIVGLVEFMRKYGEHVMDEKLLRPGTQRRNWKHTLLSDGFIILRHPDWRTANALADIAANDITMYAE